MQSGVANQSKICHKPCGHIAATQRRAVVTPWHIAATAPFLCSTTMVHALDQTRHLSRRASGRLQERRAPLSQLVTLGRRGGQARLGVAEPPLWIRDSRTGRRCTVGQGRCNRLRLSGSNLAGRRDGGQLSLQVAKDGNSGLLRRAAGGSWCSSWLFDQSDLSMPPGCRNMRY